MEEKRDCGDAHALASSLAVLGIPYAPILQIAGGFLSGLEIPNGVGCYLSPNQPVSRHLLSELVLTLNELVHSVKGLSLLPQARGSEGRHFEDRHMICSKGVSWE